MRSEDAFVQLQTKMYHWRKQLTHHFLVTTNIPNSYTYASPRGPRLRRSHLSRAVHKAQLMSMVVEIHQCEVDRLL